MLGLYDIKFIEQMNLELIRVLLSSEISNLIIISKLFGYELDMYNNNDNQFRMAVYKDNFYSSIDFYYNTSGIVRMKLYTSENDIKGNQINERVDYSIKYYEDVLNVVSIFSNMIK